MPRPRRAAAPLEDAPFPGMEDMEQDPQPAAVKRGPGRPRKNAAPAAAKPARGRIPSRAGTGRIMSKAAMQEKVSTEIYAVVSMMAAGWEFRDPDCAAVVFEPTNDGTERLKAITDRITAMVARNPDLLVKFAQTGLLGDILQLIILVFPIAKAVFKAHGPGGTGHGEQVQIDANQFPAYAG